MSPTSSAASATSPGPQAPVVSFLPDGAIKLKIYVPEGAARRASPSARSLPRAATAARPASSADITYIAREPEFTPPVIYSLESRQTLVYLIEARAGAETSRSKLQPGQIVDVTLPAPRS